MNFLGEYALEDTGHWAATGLWIGATLAAALSDVPVLWNAPGVPHPLGRSQRPLVAAALRASSYVSLRDRGAVELLDAPPDVAVDIVPDTIAGLAALWPLASLEPVHRRFLERKGADPQARRLAVHVRNRSIAGLEMEALAARLDAFARARDLVPVLIAVGRSHDDPRVARRLAEHLTGPYLLLDDPLGLQEITAVLAHSAVYLGGSLHGYIACAAYGVPGALVARPAYRKFAGFLEHTGRMQDLARDWDEAFRIAADRSTEGRSARIPAAVLARLDEHWRRVREGIGDRARNAGFRRDFPRAVLTVGLENQGLPWALAPFLSRATPACGAVPRTMR